MTLIQYWIDRRNQVKMADGAVGNNSKWTAGIIILGDEILKGLIKDTNFYYLYEKLWKNFRTAPYLIMHVHLTGDTLNNKAQYMDV